VNGSAEFPVKDAHDKTRAWESRQDAQSEADRLNGLAASPGVACQYIVLDDRVSFVEPRQSAAVEPNAERYAEEIITKKCGNTTVTEHNILSPEVLIRRKIAHYQAIGITGDLRELRLRAARDLQREGATAGHRGAGEAYNKHADADLRIEAENEGKEPRLISDHPPADQLLALDDAPLAGRDTFRESEMAARRSVESLGDTEPDTVDNFTGRAKSAAKEGRRTARMHERLIAKAVDLEKLSDDDLLAANIPELRRELEAMFDAKRAGEIAALITGAELVSANARKWMRRNRGKIKPVIDRYSQPVARSNDGDAVQVLPHGLTYVHAKNLKMFR
jgi:hypothetical protein